MYKFFRLVAYETFLECKSCFDLSPFLFFCNNSCINILWVYVSRAGNWEMQILWKLMTHTYIFSSGYFARAFEKSRSHCFWSRHRKKSCLSWEQLSTFLNCRYPGWPKMLILQFSYMKNAYPTISCSFIDTENCKKNSRICLFS